MIDATMLGAIERYVKQAIVDKNSMVSSSALVAGNMQCTMGDECIRTDFFVRCTFNRWFP
jgi:coatomer protein complex subunit gamma